MVESVRDFDSVVSSDLDHLRGQDRTESDPGGSGDEDTSGQLHVAPMPMNKALSREEMADIEHRLLHVDWLANDGLG